MTKILISGALLAALAGAAMAQPAPLQQIQLPPAVSYPEGIAYDAKSNSLFAGSAVDGTLVRIDAATGASRPLTPPGEIAPMGSTFPAMLGMKVDAAGRLWIAGGFTGLVTQVDTTNGRILKQVKVPTAPKSLLNDLVMVGGAAYVTDTFVPVLWRVTEKGGVERWLDLDGTPIRFADGPNLNGIVATPDGKSLIVVQMNKGLLFRIDIATRKVSAIDTGGADLTGGDGLVLDGRTLYLDRQWEGEIVALALDKDLTQAAVRSRLKDPGLAWPATAAKVGDALVVVNAQFNVHDANGSPVMPFTLAKVPLARLGH